MVSFQQLGVCVAHYAKIVGVHEFQEIGRRQASCRNLCIFPKRIVENQFFAVVFPSERQRFLHHHVEEVVFALGALHGSPFFSTLIPEHEHRQRNENDDCGKRQETQRAERFGVAVAPLGVDDGVAFGQVVVVIAEFLSGIPVDVVFFL